MIQKIKQKVKDLFSKETTQVFANQISQGHVLAVRMERSAHMTHDEKALVDLKGVRVRKEKDEKTATLFFCGLYQIHVKERLQPGDGRSIPSGVILKDLKGPKMRKGLTHDRSYTLKNVILHSNGVMSVEATPQTEWEVSYGD